jgi:hypothetical protein
MNEEIKNIPQSILNVMHSVDSKLDGESVQFSDIPIHDILEYFEYKPLELYNLYTYARWSTGISCPMCESETIAADIGFNVCDAPYYRCVGNLKIEGHRFNVFENTVFEEIKFKTTPLINWTKFVVFYLSYPPTKEPTVQALIKILGTDNHNIFKQNPSAKAILVMLLHAKKSKIFGRKFEIDSFGQLIKVLKWMMSFDRTGSVDSERITSVFFADDTKRRKKRK